MKSIEHYSFMCRNNVGGSIDDADLKAGLRHVYVYTQDIPGECLGVCGQTGCVPSVVASELAAQVVRGDTLAEGTYTGRVP